MALLSKAYLIVMILLFFLHIFIQLAYILHYTFNSTDFQTAPSDWVSCVCVCVCLDRLEKW